jgi:hypothetical protein
MSVTQLHDELLFLCAYPPSPRELRRAEGELKHFHRRAAELDPIPDPEISGIAGTSVDVVFSYDIVRWLFDKVPRQIAIDWSDEPDSERMASVLIPLLPMLAEEASVDAHVPYEEWVEGAGGLAWLLRAMQRYPSDLRAPLYDSMGLRILWTLSNSPMTRTLMRRKPRRIFYQRTPILKRRDVSIAAELAGSPLPIANLSRREGVELLDMARAALATRYRELYAFTYGDPSTVIVADAGRGLLIALVGIVPERRLPLRAGFAPLLFRNGVPIGYADAYGLCERMEVSFNIFYAFRDGESAYCFARMLKLYHQLFGSTVFSIDPYQIGEGNEEAIDAGAFWFYRKLGFRSTDPSIERIARREENLSAADPSHRTSARVLRRMARSPLVYGESTDWDHFHIRNVVRRGLPHLDPELVRAKRARRRDVRTPTTAPGSSPIRRPCDAAGRRAWCTAARDWRGRRAAAGRRGTCRRDRRTSRESGAGCRRWATGCRRTSRWRRCRGGSRSSRRRRAKPAPVRRAPAAGDSLFCERRPASFAGL